MKVEINESKLKSNYKLDPVFKTILVCESYFVLNLKGLVYIYMGIHHQDLLADKQARVLDVRSSDGERVIMTIEALRL